VTAPQMRKPGDDAADAKTTAALGFAPPATTAPLKQPISAAASGADGATPPQYVVATCVPPIDTALAATHDNTFGPGLGLLPESPTTHWPALLMVPDLTGEPVQSAEAKKLDTGEPESQEVLDEKMVRVSEDPGAISDAGAQTFGGIYEMLSTAWPEATGHVFGGT
jgi:hypothetical protein